MINVRLQIGDGEILDTVDAYGLVYVSADNRFSAPIKQRVVTTFAEEEGEHISTKSIEDAFDYKVTWFVKANGSLDNANKVIARFNSMLYEQKDGESIKNFKQVSFYNDYKKVKIVGIPSPIADATEFWRDASGLQHDVVCVEWMIRVSKPSLCDFNI